MIVSIVIVVAMHQIKGIPNSDLMFPPLPFRFFRLRWWLLSAPALFYLLVWIWRKASAFLTEFWQGMDLVDRRIYLIVTIASSAFIPILYLSNSQWYMQFDIVYSIDSGWCYQNIFPQLSYYDIRHPVMSVLTFPIWATVRSVLRLFVPNQLLDVLCVSIVQIINIQFLLLIGFMIGRLSKSRYVTLFYLVSMPTLLFTVFFEKYQLCTFLLVLYVYKLCKDSKGAKWDLMLATGTMPTSIFLVADELFIREPILSKIKRFVGIAVTGVCFLICSGRIRLLNPTTLFNEVSSMAQDFGLKNLSVKECLFSFTKMIQGSLVGLTSTVDSRYLWTDILSSASLIGILALALALVGIVVNRKEHFVRICAIWLICGLVLFVVFQWSVHASPLFSIYFSWAIIPLIQKGLQFLSEKMHWKEKLVYACVLFPMLIVNVINVMDIGIFLK